MSKDDKIESIGKLFKEAAKVTFPNSTTILRKSGANSGTLHITIPSLKKRSKGKAAEPLKITMLFSHVSASGVSLGTNFTEITFTRGVSSVKILTALQDRHTDNSVQLKSKKSDTIVIANERSDHPQQIMEALKETLDAKP